MEGREVGFGSGQSRSQELYHTAPNERSPWTWAILNCLPRIICRKLALKWSSWDSNWLSTVRCQNQKCQPNMLYRNMKHSVYFKDHQIILHVSKDGTCTHIHRHTNQAEVSILGVTGPRDYRLSGEPCCHSFPLFLHLLSITMFFFFLLPVSLT